MAFPDTCISPFWQMRMKSGLVRAAWRSGTLDEWEEPLSQTFSLVGCGVVGALQHILSEPHPQEWAALTRALRRLPAF